MPESNQGRRRPGHIDAASPSSSSAQPRQVVLDKALPYRRSRVEVCVTRTPTRRMTPLAGAMRSRAVRAGTALTLTGAALAACGGGSGSGALNGEQHKTAAEVVADAEQALASARSVHV